MKFWRYISLAFNQLLPLTIAIPVTFEKTPDASLQSEYPLPIYKMDVKDFGLSLSKNLKTTAPSAGINRLPTEPRYF